ncbi:MAG: hypothetical protein IPL48_11920 [Bacteroidetes bacterium]|nr:hypothetical protein [Bacteroidota bacterium]
MQNRITKFTLILSIIFSGVIANAQAPIDGFYPGKNNGAIAVSGSFESYDEFFLGDGSEANWADDYNTNTIGIYGTYGITDKFAVAVSVPYIMINTMNFNDEEVNRKGIQDLGLYAKYKVINAQIGSLNLSASPALGFSTPLSNYVVDFYGIGQHATAVDLRAIVMATFNNGLFAEAQGAGLVRFDPAPSGSQFNFKAGYFNSKFYGDVFYAIQSIHGGEDLPNPSDFKALGVSYSKAGITLAYNIFDMLGIYVGGAVVLDGENVGKSTRYNGGVVVRW